MREPFLPQHRFNFLGALVLLLGMIVPTVMLSLMNVGFMFAAQTTLQYEDMFLVVMNAAMWLGAIFAYDFIICRPQTKRPLNFNLSAKDVSTHAIIFPMMLGMIFIAEFCTSQIPVTGPFFGKMFEFFSEMMAKLTNDFATMLLLAVVMAPIFEEIVFRGIIQKGLINNGVKPTAAIWIAAVIFGLVHGNPWQFVGAVLLGVAMGIVYHRTGSLLLPILLHAFNNLIGSLLYYYTDSESIAIALNVSEFALLLIGIVLFALFYYLLIKKYPVPTGNTTIYERNSGGNP